MHWVLQNNIFKEEAFDTLISTLQRFGISYSEHKVVPFVGTLLPIVDTPSLADIDEYADPLLAKLKGPVICMGSYSMRHAAKKYNWNPGVFDLMEAGNFENCMTNWSPELMLNGDSVVLPFKDVHWTDGERFLRPTDDSKYFAGTLMELDEFLEWQKNVCILKLDYGNSLTGETLIQVAKPKKIYTEYRCWVIKGKIATMSLYKRGDKVIYQNMDNGTGDDARAFAQAMIRQWSPAAAFCLDVCETPDGWKIVEVNTLNSCGFYAADLPKLVMALEAAFG
jgi:hypothetical protein